MLSDKRMIFFLHGCIIDIWLGVFACRYGVAALGLGWWSLGPYWYMASSEEHVEALRIHYIERSHYFTAFSPSLSYARGDWDDSQCPESNNFR